MDEALYPPLSAALVRRANPRMPTWNDAIEVRAAFAEDVRFFALSWAAGFAFFLIYLG